MTKPPPHRVEMAWTIGLVVVLLVLLLSPDNTEGQAYPISGQVILEPEDLTQTRFSH